MGRVALFCLSLAVLVAAPLAHGQNVNCTVSCTIVSDPFPPAPSKQPKDCELRDGSTVLATSGVAGPTGALYCSFTQTFVQGRAVSLTSIAIAADGERSAASSPPLVFTSSAAQSPPVAQFTGSPTSGVAPLTVNFTNSSTGSITSYAWTFGDSTTSTTTNPSKVYSAAGTYTVALTATGPGGSNTQTRTNYVTVTPPSGGTITMGETAITPLADNGNADLLLAQNATLSQQATLVSLSFYVTTAAGNLRLGVYDATGPGGGPGARKAETASFAPVVGWNTANVITQITLAPGTYWLAYLPSSSALGFRKGATAGVVAKYDGFAFGPMPATFSTNPFTDSTYHWSFYATLNVGAPPTLPAPTGLRLSP